MIFYAGLFCSETAKLVPVCCHKSNVALKEKYSFAPALKQAFARWKKANAELAGRQAKIIMPADKLHIARH